MNLALDAFGGDKAPGINISGALKALSDSSLGDGDRFDVTLVGSLEDLKPHLPPTLPRGLHLMDVPSRVDVFSDHPQLEPRRFPAIQAAIRHHANGKFDAVVSAGPTGAQVLVSLMELEKCQGITRPAIGTLLPTVSGKCLLTDVGASLVASPHHLVQFAAMGSVYVRELLGIENPRIGIVNVAGEAMSGDRVAVEAHKLLEESGFNFVGFLEGRDIPAGAADVAVVNGFVGNILLKFAEGLPALLQKMLPADTDESTRRVLVNSFDYHAFGGEPLLGIKGVSIICHGASSDRAIAAALHQAARIARLALPEKIEKFLAERFSTYYSQVKYLRSFRRGLRHRD